MSHLTAIIIDDEELSLKTMDKLIEKYCPGVKVIAMCESGEEGLTALEDHHPDIVFLDIEMPGMNGFEFLEAVENIDFEVIITTAYDEYALKAFQVSAIDYLLKPVDIQKLKHAVEKVREKNARSDIQARVDLLLTNLRSQDAFPKIAIPSKDVVDFVEVKDIVRCEADKNYTTIFTVQGNRYIFSRTLKEIADLLPSALFFRTHQSHLVNLQHITRYLRGQGGEVVMSDGSHARVSKSHKAALMKRIFEK